MFKKIMIVGALVGLLSACGARVEVPPAHLGKIVTKDGYREGTIPVSKFRLDPCMWYCDNLVLLDASDVATPEKMEIFMPTDKLNISLTVQTTLAVNPEKAESLFNSIQPLSSDKYHPDLENNDRVSIISWDDVYETYAKQIVLTETREYLSRYSIAEVTSSLEKINSDIREVLAKRIEERTPFRVRYAGVTNIKYPDIITKAQENAAERREKIQQEEAQLQISKVSLERELQETRLKRQIELEKSQIEAKSQEILRAVVDDKVLKVRQLENERAWIDALASGKVNLPETLVITNGGDNVPMIFQPLTKGRVPVGGK